MKTGIELIAQERNEQVEKHGFTAKHDLAYSEHNLIGAAAFLLIGDRNLFPLTWDLSYMKKFEDKPRKEQLIIAAALIAAEIDRIQDVETIIKKKI